MIGWLWERGQTTLAEGLMDLEEDDFTRLRLILLIQSSLGE